jgi:hypothetical protein
MREEIEIIKSTITYLDSLVEPTNKEEEKDIKDRIKKAFNSLNKIERSFNYDLR